MEARVEALERGFERLNEHAEHLREKRGTIV